MTSTGHHLSRERLRMAVAVAVLAGVLVSVVPGPAPADAAPSPAPPYPATTDCAAKAPGAVAWCMPWMVRVDKPPAGSRSHWATRCSLATTDADRESCAAASVTLAARPRDGSASVFGDGPTDGSGPAGLINCALLTEPGLTGTNPGRDAQWEAKRNACAKQVGTWKQQVSDPDPKPADCGLTDASCQIQRKAQEALGSGVRSGIQGLVDIAVQAMVYLLSRVAGRVFTATSISAPDDAFYSVYNSVAGVMVLLMMVFFLISLIVNGLRTNAGPGPIATLGGLVRAFLGITFAGGLAFLIVTAWDQATNAVIAANAATPWEPSQWVSALTNLSGGAGTLFLALLLSMFGCIGLLLLFFIMLFRGILATGAAIFGAVAMSGQVMAETRHWGRRWFWTVNALASSKFFIAELWIYGSRSAYGSDDLMTVVRAVLLIWLMVAAPWILLRLTTLWDGYLSDVNAYGLMSAGGNPLALAPAFADGVAAGAAGAPNPGSAGGGGGEANAAGVMAANTSSMPTTPADAAGIGDDSSGRQAADAASTGGDGGQVGQPASTPGEQLAGTAGSGNADTPNAQEADGVQAAARSASQTLSTGAPTAPADGSTGAPGAGPMPASGIASSPAGASGSSAPQDGGGSADDRPGGGAGSDGDQQAGQSSASGGRGAAAAAGEAPILPL
ncbi:hypothetical protein [Paractinoplanes toevensis]|uniref:TrbL/VirB6 plasmid conjugal transfer protein n=1 Tax=Paractinoplanes toevensis TaxID=571911 RepID=A0A919T6L6_9ACTN|nr:hypothetical protein [Actinoplanes toevensis]GIM89833.1 hypothetical protein Ato02nite_016260 [Actinoplanes toevensis]